MKELLLKFIDSDGEQQSAQFSSVHVNIGRHSDNDLSIPDSRISRDHIRINRIESDFYVEELGSSNGTRINGIEIIEPVLIAEGDELDCGGFVITVSFADALEETANPEGSDCGGETENLENDEPVKANAPNSSKEPETQENEAGFNILKFFGITIVIGLLLLLIVGGSLLAYSIMSPTERAEQKDVELGFGDGDFDGSSDDQGFEAESSYGDDTDGGDIATGESLPTGGSESTSGSSSSKSGSPENGAGIDLASGELPSANPLQGVEVATLSFMRKIAKNDPNPVLTSKQVAEVSQKANKVKSSKAMAANITSARHNASEIKAIAQSKNLRPQFLATAAIAKLGNNQGDVVATARQMSEILDKLNIQIGDETSDDSLIIIAAYDQGIAGEYLKMRNKLERLAANNPNVSSRNVRTIWFLRDQKSITPEEFERALRFLAIGAITQNPKLFSVNAQVLNL